MLLLDRWSEGIGVVKSMEEKKAISRAQKPQALNCPRCNSSHTKFCYYNNYNLSQPRYFCKTCRRYWTAGGSLRNVPIGGGSRKNKRSSSSSSRNHHDHMMMSQSQPAAAAASNLVSQNPNQHIIIQNHGDQDHLTISTSSQMSAMGFFKTNDYARGMMMMNSFMPMPVVGGSSNSTTMMMNSLDGFENEGGSYDDQESGGGTTITAPSTSARLFFPLEDLKPSSGSTAGENEMQGDHSNCNAYWSGGGSW